MEQKTAGLNTLCEGAATEIFEREFKRVLENINDPNTDPAAKREINLKFVFQPAPNQDVVDVKLKSSAKLAPIQEKGGYMLVDGNRAYVNKKAPVPDNVAPLVNKDTV